MINTEIKILIVDDNDLIRDFLLELFRRYELKAEVATNGREAIDKWEKNIFKAILMDIEMPIMDGMESTRIIRRREKEEDRSYTPIYAVSGTTDINADKICCEAGMDGFIAKPMIIDKILEVILPLTR